MDTIYQGTAIVTLPDAVPVLPRIDAAMHFVLICAYTGKEVV